MNDNKSTELSQPTAPGMHYTACCTLADATHEPTNEEQKIKNAKRGGIYLDLFSGIGGFAKGFDMAGFTFDKHYFSEIDKNAIANYKFNFKNAEYAGDIRTIFTGTITDRPNLITFGFPCQDLSVAGKGKGLSGARSGLFYEAVRLIEEFKPDVFIFENVKGLLSSNKGKDFELVLRTIADIGLYECEWQLLNTAWLLPQNRERVYFVGHLTGRSKPRIFPISETTSRTNEGQPNTAIVRTITAGGHSGGHHSGMTLIQRTDTDGNRRPQGYRCYESDGISPALSSQQGGIAGGSHIISHYGHKNKEATEHTICPTLKAQSHGHEPMVKALRWARNEKGKAARKEAMKNGKDYTPFNDGNRELIQSEKNISGCITNALNKDALLGNENEIRRLTEIECERLQGFPDNWTMFGNFDGTIKEISRTQRYKMLGNAVTTKVVEMIAMRI
jgi:DNA (cytosine-5)-methyltransferase 1